MGNMVESKTLDKYSAKIDQLHSNLCDFYYRRHPAWNSDLKFSERLSNLPLYYLIFSHHSRDKDRHSVTATHYVPRRQEMMVLAKIIKSYGEKLKVCDIGCGNGFLGSMLAREGMEVFGIDDRSYKQPLIPNFYDKDCYNVIETSLESLEINFDIALCSWMVPGTNLTKTILDKKPLLIIHFFSPDMQGDGTPTTGMPKAYECPVGYKFLTGWMNVIPVNFFYPYKQIPILVQFYKEKQLTLKSELMLNGVKVFVRNNLETLQPSLPPISTELYPWEEDIDLINHLGVRKWITHYTNDRKDFEDLTKLRDLLKQFLSNIGPKFTPSPSK